MHVSPALQVFAPPSVQYARQVPVVPLVVTHPDPGAQSACGLQAPSAGTLPAGRHWTSLGVW